MARYFFDAINGEGPMRDEEGMELPITDAIRPAVAWIAIDIAKVEMEDQQAVAVTVNVCDDTNFEVFSGRLSFVTEWSDPS